MKSKPDLTRLESILENTAALFWQKGFEAVTFAEIAKKTKVSQPALYAYVKNKMDLMRQVFLWSAQRGRRSIEAHIDPRLPALENLKRYVEGNLHFFHDEKIHAHSILALYYFAASSPEIRTLYVATQMAAQDRIQTFLIQAQNENKLRREGDADLALELHTTLVGFCYRALYADSDHEQKKILKLCWETYEKLIGFYKVG